MLSSTPMRLTSQILTTVSLILLTAITLPIDLAIKSLHTVKDAILDLTKAIRETWA